jgi:hypothetical protein
MYGKTLRKTALVAALGLCLTSMAALQQAHAASNDGALAGQLLGAEEGALEGATITVRNTETGLTRTVRADADGSFRFPFLPIGDYVLEVEKDGFQSARVEDVRISLGNSTNLSVPLNTTSLDVVEVTASTALAAIDVTSTESATNLTREQLQVLPVERDPLAVAFLAPGLVKGDPAFGGLSFGGSSAAENSVYINGLNVTDFYNRVGFSSVPYAFYKEFQIKTGGYSVEFGRTTGGVINAVTRSGTNEFEFGAEVLWEPSALQSAAEDRYDKDGNRYIAASRDEYDRSSLNVFASGPIVQDRLFFFAMYEARDYQPVNTANDGNTFNDQSNDDGFWGTKLDWQITDNHLLEFLAFSDGNEAVTDIYDYDFETGTRGPLGNTTFTESGGDNYALTYTGYLTDALSMKVLYGGNERNRSVNSANDINCNRVFDNRPAPLRGDQGCTTSSTIEDRTDDREALRFDFEWSLGDHLLRFGLDREVNTSEYKRFNPGPGGLRYDVFATTPGATLANGGVVPEGVTAYVRTRQLEVDGDFETENSAYYIEDNWSVSDNVVLNIGARLEGFDNKNGEGASYIKIDDMFAPRLGFSWDVNGDGRSKVFGNLGRYFLPVANVINIKQAGGFLDERGFYTFEGYEELVNNGQDYLLPILGPQIGPIDNSQGDGTVGDLRGEVDADMDPVHQDELILGYQGMFDEHWSWGVRGIYRRLTNAIDDMEITSNGILCDGEPGSIGYVMGNPGEDVTVYTDTDCDGENDGYVVIDTSQAGWALYDDEGNYVGERGFDKPSRNYKALEFQIDRIWDDVWALNASYTLAYSRGNAEGPVNSDTDFADAGRTENFDDPFVNLDGYGYLPSDRRHQIKARGSYAISDHWQIGATLNVSSGGPITGFGVGNPFDGTNYHSFYICVENCTAENPSERVYRLSPRGGYGRLPWTYEVGASVTYLQQLGEDVDLRVKFSVFNLFDQQRKIEVDQDLDSDIGSVNESFLQATSFQAPRYGQLLVSLNF